MMILTKYYDIFVLLEQLVDWPSPASLVNAPGRDGVVHSRVNVTTVSVRALSSNSRLEGAT
jgi:hypothetical protein